MNKSIYWIAGVVIIVAFGWWYAARGISVPVNTAPAGGAVACTMEAKLCPDGSYVGRTGPNCEFTACPAATSTAPAPATLKLNSVSPTSANVGATVTLTGTGFTSSNTILLDGMLGAKNVNVSSTANEKQILTFVVPSSLSADCKAGQACPMFVRLVTTGSYTVSVENDNGTSNTLNLSIKGASVSGN